MTHGDIWDYLYMQSLSQPQRTFLPLTLEMGSWLWVRKNPRQMLDFFGYFNPVIGHRHHRVLRQHLPLFEFLTAMTANAVRHVQIIGVPMDLGASRRGTDMGPSALRIAGLVVICCGVVMISRS